MANIIEGAEKSAPILRDLKSADVWQLVRVLKKIGISDISKNIDKELLKKARFESPTMVDDGGEIVKMPEEMWTPAQRKKAEEAKEASGEAMWQVLGQIMDHIDSCEGEVNKLLAMGIGVEPAEMSTMDANEYLELIVQYITRDGFRDFFMQAWRLLQKMDFSKTSTGITQILQG